MEDITKIDLYELLSILPSASKQDVKKAYRKSALKCHPDKNPDNPKAAELFHQLSKALEILTDDSARAAYDKVLNAKKAAVLRNKELDSKRKKFKEDLEERERQAQFGHFQEKSAEDKLKAEIERLRKEGSKQLEEEIEIVRAEIKREQFSTGNSDIDDASLFRLKVTWKPQTNGETYDHENLEKIFLKYGEIAALVVSSKKKGNALLEFINPMDAVKAHNLEKGFMSNPLTVSWLTGKAPQGAKPRVPDYPRPRATPEPGATVFPAMNPDTSQRKTFPCFSTAPAPDMFTKSRQEKADEDFEAAVLSRMRQAQEERRRTENGGNSEERRTTEISEKSEES